MSSNKVSVGNHLKVTATPSLATIIFTESAQIGKSSKPRTDSWLKSKWLRTVETIVLICVILFVCGLFTIPTIIIFAIPPLQSNEGASTNISCQDGLNDKNVSALNCVNTSSVPGDRSELRCADGFFLDNSSSSSPLCIPLCKSWLTVGAEEVALAVCLVLAIISSIILLIVTKLQKDAIFVYPTFYLVYVCVTMLFADPFFIIGSLLKAEVFCSSDDLNESFMNSSPFCVINGIVGVYLLLQIILLVTFHAVGLFWGIIFPFHYRKFKARGKIKYIHAITVVLGLVLPAIPALLHLIDGYTIGINLHSSCIGRNTFINFSLITLPMSILGAVTTSVFVILLWKIFKELILKKLLLNKKPVANIGKAEVKIFVIMCYYIILGVILLSIIAYSHTTAERNTEMYRKYFTCQSAGIQPDRDCGDPPDIHNMQTLYRLTPVGSFLQSLMPIVILIFIIDWKCNHNCLTYERT